MTLHHQVSELTGDFCDHKADSLDFDPEERADDVVDNPEDSSFSGDDGSQNDAREHYEDVGYIL